MPQHHDIGHRKRLAREARAEARAASRANTPLALARRLVRLGLATPAILGQPPQRPAAPNPEDTP